MTLKSFLQYHSKLMLKEFNLSHYLVTFYPSKLEPMVTMSTVVDVEYLRAQIRYSPLVNRMWRLRQRRLLLKILCHEITHILTEQLWTSKSSQTNNEQVTEHLSRLLFRLYEAQRH